jgi:hypothetical protein
VNTAIIILEREIPPSEMERKNLIPDAHSCLMADLTQVSIHENYSRFLQLLYRTSAASEIGKDADEGIHIMTGDTWRSESSPEYALYRYPQNLIRTNSNIPIFVASPKLYALMNDTTAPLEYSNLSGKRVPVRSIEMNGKPIELAKLGDIAEVKQGLATGDNEAYLFQNPEARGNYRSIDSYREYLLTEEDLEKIRSSESLRMAVIEQGISKDDPTSGRYFYGRYIVPYDKGGESDARGGWMPNYWVPTNYFIDWSAWAVNRMKNLTTKERNAMYKKPGGNNYLCSRFQNANSYYQPAISFSRTGVYAPTFRFGSSSPFDTEGSMMFFPNSETNKYAIVICASKIIKFQLKNYIGHTVHTQVDELKECFFYYRENQRVTKLIKSICDKQIANNRYDYASNEQIEIDRLVYEAYGLNEDDIREVENWYARRYPALAAAQRANLERKLAAEKETAR